MPFTINRCLDVPNTGDLPGAWGTTAVNPNMAAIDGAFGGALTLALGAATTITLAVGAGSTFTPGAGPHQSDNALLKFSGTLTGNAVIKFTMPGFYIVHNACGSASSFYIQLSPSSGGGNSVAAPPGRKVHVFFDGTDMDFVNMPETGSALDLSQNTTGLPVWMSACTVSPYLIKDGSVYNFSQYPALGQYLGSTFGGNGVSTFGVPDERARFRLGLDTGATGRVTALGSGVTATTLGANGGSQSLQQHEHDVTVTDPGHTHTFTPSTVVGAPGSSFQINPGAASAQTAVIGTSVTNITAHAQTTGAGTGSGQSANIPPCVVSCLPLIKT